MEVNPIARNLGRKDRQCWLDRDPTVEPSTYTTVAYQSLCGLSVLTIFLIFYINYRVVKIVKAKDMVIILMLICLQLSLFSFAVFFGFESALEKSLVCPGPYYYCMTALTLTWSPMTIGIAMVLTFNKWVNYTMFLLAVKYKLTSA